MEYTPPRVSRFGNTTTPRQNQNKTSGTVSEGGVSRGASVSNYYVPRSSKKPKKGETNRDICGEISPEEELDAEWRRAGISGCYYKVVYPIDCLPRRSILVRLVQHTSKNIHTGCGVTPQKVQNSPLF